MSVKRGGGKGRRQMADINVTPMVDVMLVLLVIFMVTAPLLTTGVSVDLPRADAPQVKDPDNKAVTVSVAADGQVFIQETPIALEALAAKMIAVTKSNPDAKIYVRGDTAIQYGTVMQVLGTLYSAGFTKAALITQMPQAGGGAKAKAKGR